MTELLDQLIDMEACPACGLEAEMGLVHDVWGGFSKICYCDDDGVLKIRYDIEHETITYGRWV